MILFKSTYLDISLLVTGAAGQGSQGTQCALSCGVSCEYLYIRQMGLHKYSKRGWGLGFSARYLARDGSSFHIDIE